MTESLRNEYDISRKSPEVPDNGTTKEKDKLMLIDWSQYSVSATPYS